MPTFIAGRALDSVDNSPLPGAIILEASNPSNTSQADSLGAFSLNVSDPETKLIISYPGYQPLQDLAVNLNGDDWLVSNDKAFASLYQAVKKQGQSIPGILITSIIIIIFFKLFKVV